MSTECESCGRPDDDLETVRRIYLTPGADDGDDRPEQVVEGDVEEWCASCRATYPHRPADG